MFEATLSPRDPEGTLRWAAATSGLLGTVLSWSAAVVVYYTLVIASFVLAYMLSLLFGGPAPTLPTILAPPPPVPVVELTLDEELDLAPPAPLDDTLGLAEPDDIIGEAPDPDAYLEAKPVEPGIARIASVRAESRVMLLGTLGSDSGALADVLNADGNVFGDLEALDGAFSGSSGVGGLIGAKGVEVGHGGMGFTGSGRGGGGTAEGLGGLGTRGVGRGGGGRGTGRIGGLASAGPSVLRGTSDKVNDGETDTCTVYVRPDHDEPLAVSRCPDELHDDARRVVRENRRHRKAGRVLVKLGPA